MKIVVYTCITNSYDQLNTYHVQHNPDIDFICFTDNPTLIYNDNGWIIKPIPQDLQIFSKVKQQRLLKILPHKYLNNYDISIWVDGNIQVRCDIEKYLLNINFDKYCFYTRKHPSRNCIYEEGNSVIRYRKDSVKSVDSQLSGYKKEGFPKNFGLVETAIIIRKHNDKKCMILDNMWAKELINKSHRDQLSFDYVRWKTGIEIGYFKLNKLNEDNNFRWRKHG